VKDCCTRGAAGDHDGCLVFGNVCITEGCKGRRVPGFDVGPLPCLCCRQICRPSPSSVGGAGFRQCEWKGLPAKSAIVRVQYVLLKSTICSFGSPSNASMIATLQATCPNVVHGLTSWNFNIVFLVDLKEQVLSDAEARLW
jgi:hypothetical protein